MVSLAGYWSDEYRNNYGEDLQTCIEKYGYVRDTYPKVIMGTVRVVQNILVYLDERKTPAYSWMFSSMLDGEWCHVRLHREDRVPVIVYDFAEKKRLATCLDYYEDEPTQAA